MEKTVGLPRNNNEGEEMIAVDSPVTINNPAKGVVAPCLLALALGATAPMAAMWAYSQLAKETPNPPAATDTDTNTKYAIEAMEGE